MSNTDKNITEKNFVFAEETLVYDDDEKDNTEQSSVNDVNTQTAIESNKNTSISEAKTNSENTTQTQNSNGINHPDQIQEIDNQKTNIQSNSIIEYDLAENEQDTQSENNSLDITQEQKITSDEHLNMAGIPEEIGNKTLINKMLDFDDTNIEVPFFYASNNGLIVTKEVRSDSTIKIYFKDDSNLSALNEIYRLSHCEYELELIDDRAFNLKLEQHYAAQTAAGVNSFAEGIDIENNEELDVNDALKALNEPDDLLNQQDDAPIIKLMNAILFEAIREKVSDIHIEPYEKELHFRYRLDGILQTVFTCSFKLTQMLVSRVKIMANLDIAEKRIPQDGRISIKIGGRTIDLRVSTLPSAHGERIVLRILDKQSHNLTLENLGMDRNMIESIVILSKKPHGIILVTGPTGSGKTSTLYAALDIMDKKQMNIMTVEDPIEYYFEGINQTQVNTKSGMTFSKGLRALLRQDPDVILVGEIRDGETAEIATQASLTGHLVLSTLHTNTAVGAITRLRDMGVESFLISSTIQAIIAQRLVRKLCEHCKVKDQPNELEKNILTQSLKDVEIDYIYREKGCKECFNTGYQGRLGLYELLVIDEEVRQKINDQAAEVEIKKYLLELDDYLPIKGSGLIHVVAGRTTLDEVLRVTQ